MRNSYERINYGLKLPELHLYAAWKYIHLLRGLGHFGDAPPCYSRQVEVSLVLDSTALVTSAVTRQS